MASIKGYISVMNGTIKLTTSRIILNVFKYLEYISMGFGEMT
jgi:hypothetical protein